MELDDLKLAWQSLDRRLAAQNAMTFLALKEHRTARARSALRPLAIGQCVQLAIGVFLSVPFAQFWIAHLHTPHLVICGALLHAYAVLLIVLAARDLHAISSIDYAAPVLDIQKRIEALRAWRVRIAPLFGITGCFIWIPLMLVIFRWLGADVWAQEPQVVYWFIASGAIALAILAVIAQIAKHPSRRRMAESIEAGSAGRSVQRAQSALAEIAAFEREEPR